MKTATFVNIIIITSLILLSTTVFSQPFEPPAGPDAGGSGPIGTPIDGGLTALIAGGAAILARKVYKDRKESEL